MRNLTLGELSELEKFKPFIFRSCYGLVNPSCLSLFIGPSYSTRKLQERMKKEFKEHGPGEGWQLNENVYGKFLHKREAKEFPAVRFLNNLNLFCKSDRLSMPVIPEPIALFYSGQVTDYMQGIDCNAIYLSRHVPGKNLLQIIGSNTLSEEKLEGFVVDLGHVLKLFREKSAYPLDFAPRDIVIPGILDITFPSFYLVDNEEATFGIGNDISNPLVREAIQKQIDIFSHEYGHLPNFDKLKVIFEGSLRG